MLSHKNRNKQMPVYSIQQHLELKKVVKLVSGMTGASSILSTSSASDSSAVTLAKKKCKIKTYT